MGEMSRRCCVYIFPKYEGDDYGRGVSHRGHPIHVSLKEGAVDYAALEWPVDDIWLKDARKFAKERGLI